MKKEQEKSDWFDDHVEVMGLDGVANDIFKVALKEMAIKKFGNVSKEEEKESEVKDDWLYTKSVCTYKFNVDDDIYNYKLNLEEKVVEWFYIILQRVFL